MRRPKNKILKRKPLVRETQAHRVIAKFGGHRALVQAAKKHDIPLHLQTTYRWLKPRPLGSDGYIPGRALERLLILARLEGVYLSLEDISPIPALVREKGYLIEDIPSGDPTPAPTEENGL